MPVFGDPGGFAALSGVRPTRTILQEAVALPPTATAAHPQGDHGADRAPEEGGRIIPAGARRIRNVRADAPLAAPRHRDPGHRLHVHIPQQASKARPRRPRPNRRANALLPRLAAQSCRVLHGPPEMFLNQLQAILKNWYRNLQY